MGPCPACLTNSQLTTAQRRIRESTPKGPRGIGRIAHHTSSSLECASPSPHPDPAPPVIDRAAHSPPDTGPIGRSSSSRPGAVVRFTAEMLGTEFMAAYPWSHKHGWAATN